MDTQKKVWDRSLPITIKILSGTEKSVLVRYPTDEEWARRQRKQKIVRTQVTGGKFHTEVKNVEASDADLLNSIRMDTDDPNRPQFTDAEASKFIGKLDSTEVREVARSGDRFSITIKTKVGSFTHVLRTPMEDAARKFARSSSHGLSGRRLDETTVSLEPSKEFYDGVFVSAEGYADSGLAMIPINHKDVVVVELLAAVKQVEDELDPED